MYVCIHIVYKLEQQKKTIRRRRHSIKTPSQLEIDRDRKLKRHGERQREMERERIRRSNKTNTRIVVKRVQVLGNGTAFEGRRH